MDQTDQYLTAHRVRMSLDKATFDAIKLREHYDLGDIPTRLHRLREEIAAIEHELTKDGRQLSMW